MKLSTIIKCGLMATCFAGNALMAQEFQLSPSREELIKTIQSHHPKVFGVKIIDQNVVKDHRTNLQQFDGKVPEAFFASHDSAILPLFTKLEHFLTQYGRSHPDHKFTGRLLHEMKFHGEDQNMSPFWLLGMHLRFAASISCVTDDERNLFSHVPFPNYFFGLLEKDAWKHGFSASVSLDNYPNNGFEFHDTHWSSVLKPPVMDLLGDSTLKLLPSPILYPLIGQGKLGVPLMIESNLNDVYPVCFPTITNNGHGIKFSQFGFSVHDMLHKFADRRRHNVTEHVMRRAESYTISKGSAWKFAEVYPTVAAQRYRAVMGALKSIYADMITKLLPRDGMAAFNRTMVGFFWTLHEAPNFTSKLYDMNDFGKILDTITAPSLHNSVAVSTDELDSWESSYDPLSTSPIDGSTDLTDAEILDHPAIKSLTVAQAQRYKLGSTDFPSSPITTVYSADKIVLKAVNRTPRFIDVTFTMFDGEKLVYSFPTLYHKWTNLDDNLGLLQYGGKKLTKPTLPTGKNQIDNARLIAQSLLDEVRKEIIYHVGHFHDVASYFSKDDSNGNKRSLENRFFHLHFKQEQKVAKALEPVAPVAPPVPPVPPPVLKIVHPNGDVEIQFPNGDIWMEFADNKQTDIDISSEQG